MNSRHCIFPRGGFLLFLHHGTIAGKILQNPAIASKYATEAGEIIRELAHSLTLADDPVTRFKGQLGTRKQVAWAEPLPLDEVKAVSKAFGCTVNDVLISAVTGAFREYMVSAGDDREELPDIRVTVPVNLRPLEHAQELGNHFGLVFLSLPLSMGSPLERLYAVNDRMNELKSSKQAAVTLGFLAALGIYGVQSYAVASRTREIGIRMALGARDASVMGMVLKEGLTLAGFGVVIGLAISAVLSRTLSSVLYQVQGIDPVVFAAVSVFTIGVTALATSIPARRATRVDPIVTMKSE